MPIFFGLLTSAAVAVIYIICEAKLNFSLQSYMVMYFIPMGALLGGLAAGCGMYLDMLISNRKPRIADYVRSSIMAVALIIGVYYGLYSMTYVDGNGDINYVQKGTQVSRLHQHNGKPYDFPAYLYYDINGRVYTSHSETGSREMKNKFINWILFALELLGCMLGAAITMSMVSVNNYCGKCMKYYRSKRLANFSDSRLAEFESAARPAGTDPASFEALLAKKSGLYGKYRLNLDYCPGCGDAVLSIKTWEQSMWKTVLKTGVNPSFVTGAITKKLLK